MFADDYVSEAEALGCIYDGADDYIDENGDYNLITRDDSWLYGFDDEPVRRSSKKKTQKHDWRNRPGKRAERLSDDIEAVRETNKKAKTGSKCTCPMCKKEFTKTSYQMTFCSSKCRLKYNNARWWV